MMSLPSSRLLLLALGALAWAACDSESAAPATVTLSGTAYVKNSTTPVAGATVAIAELPALTTVTDAAGHWSLEVPDRTSVTAHLVMDGFVPTHTQTFTTAGQDLEDIHFQMIPPALFEALAGALGVVPDPTKCQISTEVSDVAAQDLTLAELIAQRPLGVAGAVVSLSPTATPPVYFAFGDPFDLPDAGLSATSTSGGLVSTQVTPGVYTISATHPSRTFESITVTCEAGRFINATVPRGLRETTPAP